MEQYSINYIRIIFTNLSWNIDGLIITIYIFQTYYKTILPYSIRNV